ncbi:MAG: tetratricopeptide repeat protein [Gaiellaceae bacterium]
MARGAAQAQRKRRAQQAQPKRKRSAPSWEEQLFFSRLRRHAKVIYVALALVFAVGFVAFGVGSGSTGISDILRGNFFGGGSNSTSSRIKDDQKKITQNPKNTTASLDLAALYQQQQKLPEAIATLEGAAAVQPKNLDVVNALARIYRGQAEQARTAAITAQDAFTSSPLAPPGLDPNSTFGQTFTSDPWSQSLKNQASTAYSTMTQTFAKAEVAYERVVIAARGTAQEANAQLQLGSMAFEAVQLTGQPGDARVAIAAYKRYLKLQPTGISASQARQTIAQLQTLVPKTHS